MAFDTTLLSRAQFGFTIGFHILFPTFNLGLAMFLSIMEGLWLKTRSPLYLGICKFWTKIFALTFGMGVVSGIVLSYELGTNFGPFTQAVGSVLGALFSYEVLSAFFLEAGFLGVMLFGWNRVSPRLHYAATLLVMLGTTISAFWIMSANSWMQTPSGYHIVAGRYIVDSWTSVIFNPSFIPRFMHMVMASYVTTSFVIAGISAWYLLKKHHEAMAKQTFSFALGAAIILTPLQIYIGDTVGLAVHQNQPLKTAAMEGVWSTQRAAPFVVFAWPAVKEETNLYAITIPYLASLINTHRLDGQLIGLKSVAPMDRPIVAPVFFGFRIMLAIGLLLIGFAVMDGFDLGVGMLLYPVARKEEERRLVLNTIGPVWEGNQIWLVLGGGAIFAAWPSLYAVSFSGFYFAMLLVLLALIIRPVGFKYRSKLTSAKWRAAWDAGLFIAGFLPALLFGVAVGNGDK
jgi:cytochrome d ubiquinol oxidase subunit I